MGAAPRGDLGAARSCTACGDDDDTGAGTGATSGRAGSSSVAMHAEALGLLEALADAADDAALQSLIATLNVAVQEHYDTAQDLQDAF